MLFGVQDVTKQPVVRHQKFLTCLALAITYKMSVAPSQSIVLGKRKHLIDNDLVLRLTSPSNDELSDGGAPSTHESQTPIAGPSVKHMLVNGSLVPISKKRYRCSAPGCSKAYTKPSRLEEHERSHTGDVRVFVSPCSIACDAVISRDRLFARPVTSLICEKRTSTHTHGHIYPKKADLLLANDRIAQSGSGQRNTLKSITPGMTARDHIK